MLGLRTCIYKVDDLKAATKWYSTAFGVEPYFEEPFYVGFNIGGFELGLQPIEEEVITKGNNVLTYWGVDDIESTFDTMLANGAKPHETPHSVGGPLKVATVIDPWENIIGLIFNPLFENK